MIFYKNIKDNKIALDVESTGCNSLDELAEKGWKLVKIEGKWFYKIDDTESKGYYEWSLKEQLNDFLRGTKNGTCFLSQNNAEKAVKYLRRLALKDLCQVGENAKKEEE